MPGKRPPPINKHPFKHSSSVSLSVVTEQAIEGPPPNATDTVAASMISARCGATL
jgi:hypothetical protein